MYVFPGRPRRNIRSRTTLPASPRPRCVAPPIRRGRRPANPTHTLDRSTTLCYLLPCFTRWLVWQTREKVLFTIHGSATRLMTPLRLAGEAPVGISLAEGSPVAFPFGEGRVIGIPFGEGAFAGFAFDEPRETRSQQIHPRQTEFQQITDLSPWRFRENETCVSNVYVM